jgi:hypothetical protein
MDSKGLYEIEKVSDRLLLVIGTTYVNPISSLSSLDKDLSKIGFDGKVVFDLLLSNGYSSNRFVEACTDGYKIHLPSMKILGISSLDESILSRLHCFYKSHPYLLEANHILLDEEKSRLMHN